MLNPITFTEKVVGDFLRYQLSTYGFADERLNTQLRELLSLETTRDTPLLKGPYISLSKAFREGGTLGELGRQGVLHPHIANLTPHPRVWGHQEEAIRSIVAGRTTLVSTGTGSGKTECFLYPIISRCLTLRDEGAAPGIVSVIVYPMNALAEDQLGRLRDLLAGTGITFGMYVGKTPERTADVAGVRLGSGASREDYRRELAKHEGLSQAPAVHPFEERVSREQMRTPGQQPRVLLTNVKQLELLLTRQKDYELFQGASLDFLVFDEAHTFSGAAGAETACLIRRLRSYCGRKPEETVCVGTSATIADKKAPDAARRFATRFFGVPEDDVSVVTESYEDDAWSSERSVTPGFHGDFGMHLRNICEGVAGVEGEEPAPTELAKLKLVSEAITGKPLDTKRWQESLYERLSENEVVYQIAKSLERPKSLKDLPSELEPTIGRGISEEEILSWLALGAASSKDGRPLLRPVVHAFVQGVTRAVVTFPVGQERPLLWLSPEDATEKNDGQLFRLPVMSCTTCGQHYFEHWLQDWGFTDRAPGGGEAVEDGRLWRALEESRGGNRAILVDRLAVGEPEDEELESPLDKKAAKVWFCRRCGTLHPRGERRCLACGTNDEQVELWAVQCKSDPAEKLTRCLGCGANARRSRGTYREPARPLRATPVADVHVLAQSMIQHAERKRLLVFADNRQDAAFQAGWMQDHARRYRLRSLMYERIRQSPVSVGDLVGWLDWCFDEDDDLSRALLPEVWRRARKEAAGQLHQGERRKYLRIQVLRELTAGGRQRIGLEPWGRIVVDYLGLSAELPFFQEWSKRIGCKPDELCEGVAAFLDTERRARVLYDPDLHLFSRYWRDGDAEVQWGYIPDTPGGPRGVKLRREPADDGRWVRQWLSEKGDTPARQCSRRWGVDAVEEFLESLWKLLRDELRVLVPVRLLGHRGKALPGCAGVCQLDADRILIRSRTGLYRCNTCKKPHPRPTPGFTCTVWRCQGALGFEPEDPDNYDLILLDQQFAMLRAREHSAQIPAEDREALERSFKGSSERLNTLVCTPTLELGVDIGALDSVLMRNMPPLPSNYWQRVGRAGRRQRMAVNLTYARPASHDRAFFAEPLRMLEGSINPPRINLKNAVMVEKHVRATILTALHGLCRDATEESEAKQATAEAVASCFPNQIRDYLFSTSGHVRTEPFDVSPLASAVERHSERLIKTVVQVFSAGWPFEDASVVRQEALAGAITGSPEELSALIGRLRKRLQWALEQMRRLDEVRVQKGTLDSEEQELYRRCDRVVKRLKGVEKRQRREAEGYDDSNTFAVLAAEGYLPGYGLDTGWVIGSHIAPLSASGFRDWELRRGAALALREYVPGNSIYANGHRFVARRFHLEPDSPARFQVDAASESVREVKGSTTQASASLGALMLDAVPVCDVDLPHQSQISDEEDYRFQLPVAVYGYEQGSHAGGLSWTWGNLAVNKRSAVRFRLVNVGAAKLVTDGKLGYPVCRVCGQSRSPFASDRELQKFGENHLEICRKRVDAVGFYADVTADALKLEGFTNREQAYTVAEAIRVAAAELLEMEQEDLQLLAIGRSGEETPDIVLYDPMPGGSGILDDVVARWGELSATAREHLRDCPSQCHSACVDCLLQYRNAFYHRYLNRESGLEALIATGDALASPQEIPPRMEGPSHSGAATNPSEEELKTLLIRAELTGFSCQESIDLGKPLGTTTPDFFFPDGTGHGRGICIYLDGLSRALHGKPETAARDREIRDELRAQLYTVIEIPASHLSERVAMRRHLMQIGGLLNGREAAERIRHADFWNEPC